MTSDADLYEAHLLAQAHAPNLYDMMELSPHGQELVFTMRREYARLLLALAVRLEAQ